MAVDVGTVRSIVALESDHVLRNLWITQRYHELSEEVRARTRGGDMNWCTLGTWASKTAGAFIRGDEIPGAFKGLLARGDAFGHLAHLVDPARLLDLAARVASDASTYLMMGNLVVFSELAQVFEDFVHLLGDDTVPDPGKLRRFQETLSDGEPAPDEAVWDAERRTLRVTPRGGQGLLRGMVGCYYAAMFETDPKRRAELLLLGNARGGIHEQTRLQTYIAGALDAPIADTLLRHAHDHVERTVGTDGLRRAAHSAVDACMTTVGRTVEQAWEDIATVEMMALTLPDGVVHLGSPIPSAPGVPAIPPTLETIEHPELQAALAQFGALDVRLETTPLAHVRARFESLLGLGHPETPKVLAAAAGDWVDFNQRMRFILTLFRSRASDPQLAASPFSPAQLAAIRAGLVPAGPL